MEDKNFTNRAARAERDCFVTRGGRFGEIRGRFWSTPDELTGELTFHVELPNVVRHFQEDFDVCILVIAWNLWALAGRKNVWHRNDYGLSDSEKFRAKLKVTEFIGYGIEAWLHQHGKLAFAEGIVDRDGKLCESHRLDGEDK
jgi:hypothetical protein